MDALHRGIALIGGMLAMILGTACLEASPEFLAKNLPGSETPLWLVAIVGIVSGAIVALSAIFTSKLQRLRKR